VGDKIRTTCLFRHDWTSTIVRVVWSVDTADEMLACFTRQYSENGHLLYWSSSWIWWHWTHTPFANIYK